MNLCSLLPSTFRNIDNLLIFQHGLTLRIYIYIYFFFDENVSSRFSFDGWHLNNGLLLNFSLLDFFK